MTRSVGHVGLAAGLALAASLAMFWPGVAMYDSVAQYREALTGIYDDWHPPAMARLWSLFGARGTAPMLVLQMGLYWLGLGLLAAALARGGRRIAAGVAVAIGLWPPLLGWQAVVLKDTQMLGALLAATGIVAWWRLRGARVPQAAMVMVAVPIAYATLVRANAVFATVPLAVGLIGWPRGLARRAGVTIVGVVLVLVAAPLINHGPFGAVPTGVEKTQALYDLAAIGAATGDGAATGLTPDEIAELRARHCISPFFWDPLGAPDHCAAMVERLRDQLAGTLYSRLTLAILRHPIAYAGHRLVHLNSTDRWLVPAGWPDATAPVAGEANTLGLTNPGDVARWWAALARPLSEWPTGWPLAWIVVAVTLLAASRDRREAPSRTLAWSLLASALALEASFAALSIASDVRYHLWPMVATALAGVLLAEGGRWRRTALSAGGGVLALVMVGGAVARVVLPAPPATYQGMFG